MGAPERAKFTIKQYQTICVVDGDWAAQEAASDKAWDMCYQECTEGARGLVRAIEDMCLYLMDMGHERMRQEQLAALEQFRVLEEER